MFPDLPSPATHIIPRKNVLSRQSPFNPAIENPSSDQTRTSPSPSTTLPPFQHIHHIAPPNTTPPCQLDSKEIVSRKNFYTPSLPAIPQINVQAFLNWLQSATPQQDNLKELKIILRRYSTQNLTSINDNCSINADLINIIKRYMAINFDKNYLRLESNQVIAKLLQDIQAKNS